MGENQVDFFTEFLKMRGFTGQVRLAEPMKAHTTFRIGGPAGAYVTVRSPEELKLAIAACRAAELPYQVIGNGSNLLVSDAGIAGVIIALVPQQDGQCTYVLQDGQAHETGADCGAPQVTPESQKPEVTKRWKTLFVWGGELLASVSKAVSKQGLTGLEWASGIPGTIGGGIFMNAGAYGGCMADVLQYAVVIDEDGREWHQTPSELQLSYRYSNLESNRRYVAGAVFTLAEGDASQSLEQIAELTKKRREKQPLQYPSAGSTFKRPEGYFAGKLIEDAGLRGYTVGGAQVSEKHCGFVINRGEATAEDVLTLMADVHERVLAGFGVGLEPEVRMLGDFSKLPERVKQICHLPQM